MSWVTTLKTHQVPLWLDNKTGEYKGQHTGGLHSTKEGCIPLDQTSANLMLHTYNAIQSIALRKKYEQFEVAVALDFAFQFR